MTKKNTYINIPQIAHNDYVKKNNIKGGIIKGITEKNNWQGLLDAREGTVYESTWCPRYQKNQRIQFPIESAMKHDRKFQTYYAFSADKDFNPHVWRHLFNLHQKSNFVKDLAEYAWQKYIFDNEETRSVMLWRCDTGQDIAVKLLSNII